MKRRPYVTGKLRFDTLAQLENAIGKGGGVMIELDDVMRVAWQDSTTTYAVKSHPDRIEIEETLSQMLNGDWYSP